MRLESVQNDRSVTLDTAKTKFGILVSLFLAYLVDAGQSEPVEDGKKNKCRNWCSNDIGNVD